MDSINPISIVLKHLEDRRRHWELTDCPLPKVGVAYSGGRDSSVLLWACLKVWGPANVIALWIDHGFRPSKERDLESKLVRRVCFQSNVKLVEFGPPASESLGEGTEDALRRFRLECLEEGAKKEDLACVLTAHHADDQAETILMRLLQGRSWDGLVGIPEVRGIFRRPFLSLTRALLARVAEEAELEWHEDSTNADTSFRRNFLRQEVFPKLEVVFPGVRDALQGFASYWKQNAVHPQIPDSAWTFHSEGGRVPVSVWAVWPAYQRESQLLAVFHQQTQIGKKPVPRLSRKFLETLTQEKKTFSRQGAGWEFQRTDNEVLWQRIVETVHLGYHITVTPERVYNLVEYSVSFCGFPQDCFCFFVPRADPARPLVWRSLQDGESWSFPDGTRADKLWRRRHAGDAGLFQSGVLLAIFDTWKPGILWTAEVHGLIKTGIFVKLFPRSV